MRLARHAWMCVVLGAVCCLASPAAAQSIELGESPCPASLPRSTLSRMLAVELRGDGVSRVASEPAGPSLASIELLSECTGSVTVRIRVAEVSTPPYQERVVDLSGMPESLQARLLALSVAELLRASWSARLEEAPSTAPEEPASHEAPALRAVSTQAEIAAPAVSLGEALASPSTIIRAREASPGRAEVAPVSRARPATREEIAPAPWLESGLEHDDRSAAVSIGAGSMLRAVPSSGLVTSSALLSVTLALGPAAFLALDAGAGHSVAGPYALTTVPVALRSGLHLEDRLVRLDLAPRIEAGAIWLASDGQDERTTSASLTSAYLALTMSAELSVRLARELALAVLADLGWMQMETSLGGSTATTSVSLLLRSPY